MTILEEILKELPQKATGIEVTDPLFTVFGDGWHLTLECPWTLTGPGIASSWESSHLEDEVGVLIGRSLTKVTGVNDVSGNHVNDAIFHFDGGVEIEVHSGSYWEPWTLTLPNLVGVVGGQSDGPRSGAGR